MTRKKSTKSKKLEPKWRSGDVLRSTVGSFLLVKQLSITTHHQRWSYIDLRPAHLSFEPYGRFTYGSFRQVRATEQNLTDALGVLLQYVVDTSV